MNTPATRLSRRGHQETLRAYTGTPLFADLLVTVSYPKKYPVFPYAITNPVWVDVDGGGWTPPGLPTWLRSAVQ